VSAEYIPGTCNIGKGEVRRRQLVAIFGLFLTTFSAATIIATDQSKNSGPWGLFLLGELFQNNHHHAKNDANFAKKWFEFDLTYQVMRVFNLMGIIKLNRIH
jgi:fatty-acid desaturase